MPQTIYAVIAKHRGSGIYPSTPVTATKNSCMKIKKIFRLESLSSPDNELFLHEVSQNDSVGERSVCKLCDDSRS